MSTATEQIRESLENSVEAAGYEVMRIEEAWGSSSPRCERVRVYLTEMQGAVVAFDALIAERDALLASQAAADEHAAQMMEDRFGLAADVSRLTQERDALAQRLEAAESEKDRWHSSFCLEKKMRKDSDEEAETLREKLEAAEKDAARWRWLKPTYTAANFHPESLDLGDKGVVLMFVAPDEMIVSSDLDEMADDAIRALSNRET